MIGAELFAWLHGADFYKKLHSDTVRLLPPGDGESWLDVGCGPGVLARAAALRGYKVRAVDRSAAMIRAASRFDRPPHATIDFVVSDLAQQVEQERRYDVVSASSLLVVLPDPLAGFSDLAALTAPGGLIIVVEASRTMSRRRALDAVLNGRLGRRAYMLLPWSMARSGRALAMPRQPEGVELQTVRLLLNGLVEVRIYRRSR